jgi:hypothetical protein
MPGVAMTRTDDAISASRMDAPGGAVDARVSLAGRALGIRALAVTLAVTSYCGPVR